MSELLQISLNLYANLPIFLFNRQLVILFVEVSEKGHSWIGDTYFFGTLFALIASYVSKLPFKAQVPIQAGLLMGAIQG